MHPRMIEIMKAARMPYELNTKPGDKVLIITDTKIDPDVWGAMAAAGNQYGVEVTVAMMTPRAANGYDPTSPIMNAARDPQLNHIFYITSTALAHASITEEATAAGKNIILMEELTPEMLMQGGPAVADYDEMQRIGEKVEKILKKGKRIHVESEFGTDLTAVIEGRPTLLEAGRFTKIAGRKGGLCAFPDGEVNTCPLEGSGEGMLVFDTTAHNVGTLREPIRCTVKNGMVTKIEGGVQATKWREIIETYGDKKTYNCPAEIALGLNPMVTPTGSMRTDKKMYGAAHIGLGNTVILGGTCDAKLRMEGVIRNVHIEVDGKVISHGGKILVD